MTLEALLKHPALWKGRQQNNERDTLATGFAALDAALPSQGWPIGALTEIMVASTDSGTGIGELSLLSPALAALTSSQQWIALVAPPYVPYAPALVNAGISLEHTLIVEAESKNAFWAVEQMLRSGVFSAVVLWTSANGDERQQRRLQLAAEQGRSWAVCYRPDRTARTSSPAGLRMVLQHVDPQNHGSHNNGLQVDIIKNRGGRLRCLHLGDACHTLRPALESPDLENPALENVSDNTSASETRANNLIPLSRFAAAGDIHTTDRSQ